MRSTEDVQAEEDGAADCDLHMLRCQAERWTPGRARLGSKASRSGRPLGSLPEGVASAPLARKPV